MAIEMDTSRIAAQTASVASQNGNAVAKKTQTSPILGGESLTVTSGAATDLEKLVARLKTENENVRQSVAQRRIAILHTVLDSMADRISAIERENIIAIEKLNLEKGEALRDLATENTAKTELEIKIAELDRAIEQAVKEGEAQRERTEKLKAQREEERRKLDRVDVAIESLNAKISGIDIKISECTEKIASATLNEVAAAMRLATGETPQAPERPESDADRAKAEKKAAANDIAAIISDALDKIDDQIRRALEEAQVIKA